MDRLLSFARKRPLIATLAVLALVLMVPLSRAERCPSFFHQLGEGTVSERYRKAIAALRADRDPEAVIFRKPQVHYKLLQEVFYPLVSRLSQDIAAAEKKNLLETYAHLKNTQPVQRSKYFKNIENDDFITRVDPLWPNAEVYTNGTDTMAFNTENTQKFFVELNGPHFGRSQEFLWVNANKDQAQEFGVLHTPISTLATPIGEYGPEFAEKLLRTTQLMMQFARKDRDLRNLSRKVYADGKDLLKEAAARSRGFEAEGATQSGLTPLSTTLEGIQSLHHLFTMLLVNKAPGIETGEEALRQVIFGSHGAVSEATSRLPLGLIGPMNITGRHFHQPLVRAPDGQLTLADPTKKVLFDINQRVRNVLKSRCPMAGLWHKDDKATGLQTLAEAYWNLFSVVDKQPIQAPVK